MARSPFSIGRATVPAGSRQTVNLPVSVLSDHTPITLSAHVVHGRREGPVVFVSAGIHGDEVIGVEIVRRLLRHQALSRLSGTFIAVPIVNTFGFINHSRYLPDRRDLNRCFPGGQGGSLASRLANLFVQEIVSRSDVGIDLHSAAIHRANFPQIRISPDDARAHELALAFGAPVIIESDVREGSLRETARNLGKDILLYEAGEALRFDEMSVRAGVFGVLRVMQNLAMIPARGVAKPKAEPQFCRASTWLRAPMGGLLRSYRDNGDLVHEGDLMATISDPFGELEEQVLAPFSGIIVGRSLLPMTNEGDAVFHLGRVKSVKQAEGVVEDLSTQLSADPMFDEDEII